MKLIVAGEFEYRLRRNDDPMLGEDPSVTNENSVWRAGGFSVRTVTRRAARVANSRTEPENLRTSEHRLQWMQAERSTKNHEHVPDIQAARRS